MDMMEVIFRVIAVVTFMQSTCSTTDSSVATSTARQGLVSELSPSSEVSEIRTANILDHTLQSTNIPPDIIGYASSTPRLQGERTVTHSTRHSPSKVYETVTAPSTLAQTPKASRKTTPSSQSLFTEPSNLRTRVVDESQTQSANISVSTHVSRRGTSQRTTTLPLSTNGQVLPSLTTPTSSVNVSTKSPPHTDHLTSSGTTQLTYADLTTTGAVGKLSNSTSQRFAEATTKSTSTSTPDFANTTEVPSSESVSASDVAGVTTDEWLTSIIPPSDVTTRGSEITNISTQTSRPVELFSTDARGIQTLAAMVTTDVIESTFEMASFATESETSSGLRATPTVTSFVSASATEGKTPFDVMASSTAVPLQSNSTGDSVITEPDITEVVTDVVTDLMDFVTTDVSSDEDSSDPESSEDGFTEIIYDPILTTFPPSPEGIPAPCLCNLEVIGLFAQVCLCNSSLAASNYTYSVQLVRCNSSRCVGANATNETVVFDTPVETVVLSALNGCWNVSVYRGGLYRLAVTASDGFGHSVSTPSAYFLTGLLPPDLSVGRVSNVDPVLELYWEFPYPTFVDFVTIYETKNDAPATELTRLSYGQVQQAGSFSLFAGSPGTKYAYTIEVTSAEAIVFSNTDVIVIAPRHPQHLRIAEAGTRELSLQWTHVALCSTCTYLVEYRQADFRQNGVGGTRQFGVSCPQGSGGADMSCTASIHRLTPGVLYIIDVYATSNGVMSNTAAQVIERTYPDAPWNFTVTMVTERSIAVAWSHSEGYRSHYLLHAYGRSNVDIGEVPGDVTMFTFHNLLAGTPYTIVIAASANYTKLSEDVTLSETTLPTEPGPVGNLRLETYAGPQQVRLEFLAPVWPNGVLHGYQVQFVGTREGGSKICSDGELYLPVTQMSVIIDQLKGGCNYTFLVRAENEVGFGPGISSWISTDIGIPPIPETIPPQPATDTVRTTGFVVNFDPTIFDDVNGEITHVTVVVSEEAAAATDQPHVGHKNTSRMPTWAEAIVHKVIPPYQISDPIEIGNAASERRRKRSLPPSLMEISIGSEECSRKDKAVYCNGPLAQGRSYVYRFRGFSPAGYADTKYSLPVLLPSSPQGIIIGISIALFSLLVIVIILSIIIIVRKFRLDGRGRYLPANMKDVELTRVANNHPSTVSKQKYSRPVRLCDFTRDWFGMNSDSHYGYSEEYDVIRKVGRKMTTNTAVLAANVSKNRYTNILPYDRTRVKLSAVDDEEGSDYINANYIPGFSSPREYIACQGPLPGTIDHTWKMIWEQDVTTVVMVTQLVEKGKVKCDQYWPDDHKPVLYGDVQVTMTQALEETDWNIKEFIVQVRDQRRHVRHWNFLSWPDHGVPESSEALLAFIRRIRSSHPPSTTPIMVHCSAGVGRTGTFIILDRLLQHMEQYDYVDILGLVCEMRMHRSFMVQTEQQYVFIHRCIMDVLEERSLTPIPTTSGSAP